MHKVESLPLFVIVGDYSHLLSMRIGIYFLPLMDRYYRYCCCMMRLLTAISTYIKLLSPILNHQTLLLHLLLDHRRRIS